jgi:hypothetical protein
VSCLFDLCALNSCWMWADFVPILPFSLSIRRQYIMLGQAQLSLRDIKEFTKKGKFDVSFMDKIKVSSCTLTRRVCTS